MAIGYACLIYDLRGHGKNKSTFTTYGLRESKDLNCLIDDTKKRYSDITTLGLHGESPGAATTITALGNRPKVDFAVADCGFSDIENVLREGYRRANFPTLPVDIANFTGKLRYGYSLKRMRPIDSLNENKIPILFIHGAKDRDILLQNSKDMAMRTKGYSKMHLIPGAAHANSILTDSKHYTEYVRNFLSQID